ncbi:unnamed protein product [Camellia sinensis]
MRKTNQSKRRINGGKAAKIEEKGFGKWESLDKKLMLDIFNRLEPAFLLTTVAWVCRSWGRACYDRFFAEKGEQDTLNLRALHSMSFWNIRINFTKLLRGVMDVYACDNDDDDDDYEDGGVRVRVTPITKIMFPSEFVTVTDDHLVYAAKRSPKLRVLSVACGLYIERTGFSRAMQCWSRIEEMTISFSDSDSDNHDIGSIIEVIGINCKKLEVLCLFGLFIVHTEGTKMKKEVRTDNHKGCSSPMRKTTFNGCRMCYFEERHNMHDPMIGKYKQWSITRRPIPRKRRSALRDLSYTDFSLTCTAPTFNSYSLALVEGEFFQEVTAQSEGITGFLHFRGFSPSYSVRDLNELQILFLQCQKILRKGLTYSASLYGLVLTDWKLALDLCRNESSMQDSFHVNCVTKRLGEREVDNIAELSSLQILTKQLMSDVLPLFKAFWKIFR